MIARKWLFGVGFVGLLSAALAVALPTPRPAPAAAGAANRPVDFAIADGEEVTVGTWNIKFFYDDDKGDNKSPLSKQMSAPSKEKYEQRVKLTAAAIAKMKPTLLGLQEIENKKVVEDLAAALKTNHNLEYVVGFVQGKDTYTEQDVAFLAEKRPGDLTFDRVEDAGLDLSNSNVYKIPSKHAALHLSRTTADGVQQKLTIIVAHLKAGGSSSEPQRVRQSRVLNAWATKLMTAGNGGGVIVLGDMNAGRKYEDTTVTDGMGVLRGLHTQLLTDDMIDLNEYLVVADRRTHITGRELDRIVVSPNLIDETGLVFQAIANYRHLIVRGTSADDGANTTFYDFALEEADLSDHYPLIAKFKYRATPDVP